jgi:pimeloyl-ACP methyl ester carboxylesterase
MFRDLDRRRLLRLAIASTAILPRAEAAAPDFVEGYAIGDGAQLFYVRAGEGPLMLFLHGAPDDWSLYEDQLLEFGRDHLVVAPNLRGFPPSDQPEAVEAYAMPKLLGDISALLRHFGKERCVLVGNDWGGYFAWVFASAYPARVERLVIFNAVHPAIHLREVRNNPAQNQASQYERDKNTAPAPYPPWYNYYRADPIKIPPSVFEAANLELPDLAARFFAGVADPPATRSLRVEVPTLVFWGMQDPALLPGELDHLDDYAPHAVIIRIEDGGHYPMRSNPRLVNRMIRDFLSHTGPFASGP